MFTALKAEESLSLLLWAKKESQIYDTDLWQKRAVPVSTLPAFPPSQQPSTQIAHQTNCPTLTELTNRAKWGVLFVVAVL